MKIIISPTKTMKSKDEGSGVLSRPFFLDETENLLNILKQMDYDQLKELWQCSDKLAQENFERVQKMDLGRNLSPAILTYEGLVFKYMAPWVFTQEMWEYANEHLRILSGFYGVVSPLDGITPYRLEMQAELKNPRGKNLYEFWGRRLYEALAEDESANGDAKPLTIINLASEEYSKCIEKYLEPEDKFITIVFGEYKTNKVGQLVLDKNGQPKIVTKATPAKMARGEMVRFMAEGQIEDIEDIKTFVNGGFACREDLCDEKTLVFVKNETSGMEE